MILLLSNLFLVPFVLAQDQEPTICPAVACAISDCPYDCEVKAGCITGKCNIEPIECDLQKPCPQGLECYSFPDFGLRCTPQNPCEYYECPEQTECGLAESFPPQVICSGECVGDECEISVGFDIEIRETVYSSKPSETHDVVLKTTSSGSKGILEVNDVNVPYSKRLFIEDSKLHMDTMEGKKQINIFPREIFDNYNIDKDLIKELKLDEEKSTPTYYLESEKEVRLLFFIPIKINIKQKINGENGSIISIEKPWWSFLASGV